MLYNDIFEIEAIGPAIILHQWGRSMRNCLWLHFIDNAGAQAVLCKGSSSVHEGDLITGFVWEEIASACVVRPRRVSLKPSGQTKPR